MGCEHLYVHVGTRPRLKNNSDAAALHIQSLPRKQGDEHSSAAKARQLIISLLNFLMIFPSTDNGLCIL